MKKDSKKFWLLKSEPDAFSIDDLQRVKKEPWTGVRNYQARNNMKAMNLGDTCFFYHSSCLVPAIVGLAKVTKKFFPDPTAYDKKSEYFDPKSSWVCVEVSFVKKFKKPITLVEIKADPKLKTMTLVKPGSRLSVQPVTEQEFDYICKKA
jgi:predicted RNA-binding protein with PUA-like domain